MNTTNTFKTILTIRTILIAVAINFSGNLLSQDCGTPISTFPILTGFEEDLGDWTQDTDDDFDWTRKSGSTGSADTGPDKAFKGSFYLYTEASGNSPSKTAAISSPCLTVHPNSIPTIGFAYHMYGVGVGSLILEVSSDNGASWTTIWDKVGEQGAVWLYANVDLSAYKGQNIKLKYTATTGATDSGWKSDIGLDAISIFSGPSASTDICSDRVQDGLVAYYNFKEGAGNVVHDVSGTGSPFHLVSDDSANFNWNIDGGITATGNTYFEYPGSGKLFGEDLVTNGSFSVEAWVLPANNTQKGPARIMSFSKSTLERNFTLGQVSQKYSMRVRTNDASVTENGLPEVSTSDTLSIANPQQVIYTYDGATNVERILVNTQEVYSGTRAGDFSNWDDDHTFGFFNEVSEDRDWLGTIFSSAIYSKSLSDEEILQNYSEGQTCSGITIDAIFECEDYGDIDHYCEGLKEDIPKTITITETDGLDSVKVEIVYKGGNPGESITITDDKGKTYTAEKVKVESFADIYAFDLPATSTVTYENTTNADDAQSICVYAFRSGVPGHQYVGEYVSIGGLPNTTRNISFALPERTDTQDINLVLPISEITYDNRSLAATATAGSISQTIDRKWGTSGSGFPDGCCIDFFNFELKDVPPTTPFLNLEIVSPSSGGQSYVIAGYVFVDVSCGEDEICGDGIDNDYDTLTDCDDDDCDESYELSVSVSGTEVQCENSAFQLSSIYTGCNVWGQWTVVSGTAYIGNEWNDDTGVTVLPGNTATIRRTVNRGAVSEYDEITLTNNIGCPTTCIDPLNLNGDLEDEGTATNFDLTFESTPALLIEKDKNPTGWEERYGSIDPASFNGAFYFKKTGASSDPYSGTHAIYMKGSGNCISPMTINHDIACGKTYRFSVYLAAYSYGVAQGDAPFTLEYAAGGGPYMAPILNLTAPASNSWNDLNWQKYEFDIVIPENGFTWGDFYFTSKDSDHGIVVDDVCITEVTGGADAWAGSDASGCTNSFQLTANTPPAGYTGTWSVTGGDISLSSINDPNAIATMNTGNIGSLNWSVTDGSCSSSDDVVLEYTSLGSLSVNDETICLGESVTLTATGCSESIVWSTGEITTDISVSPTTTTDYTATCYKERSENLAQNGDFESAVDFEHWQDWGNSGITTNPADVYSGNKAVLADASNNWAGFGQNLTCEEGDYYEISFYAKSTNINNGPGFYIDFYSASWTKLTEQYYINITSVDYQEYTYSVIAPLGAKYMQYHASMSDDYSKLFLDDLVITKGTGCEIIATGTVTVDPLPIAAFGDDRATCDGAISTFTANDAGAGATYSWNFGAKATPTTAIGIGPHDVVFDNDHGTGANQIQSVELLVTKDGCQNSSTKDVTILALPEISVSSTDATCSDPNGSILFTITDNSARTDIEFSIDGGGTYPYTSADNVGTYSITVSQGDYAVMARWAGEECPIELADITISNFDSPTIQPIANDTICIGETIGIKATSLGGTGALTYNWDNGLGAGDSITISPEITTTYTVAVEDENGCQDTEQFTVKVNDVPTATIILDQTSACEGDSITLGVEESDLTYQWNNTAGNSTEQEVEVVVPNVSGSKPPYKLYKVTVTNSSGCTATASKLIRVYNKPVIDLTTDTICVGEQANISISATSPVYGGGDPVTFSWSTGSTASSIVVSPTETTSYIATAIDDEGCESSGLVEVLVKSTPMVSITGDDKICEDQPSVLTATGADNYLWSTGETSPSIAVSLNANADYSVTGTNDSGCTDSDNISVLVSPSLSANIDYNGSQCLTEDMQLTASEDGGTAPYTYQWISPRGLAGDSKSITIDTNGNYYVTITDSYGCEAYTSGFVYQSYIPTIVNLQTDICEGDAVTLSVSGSNATNYQWSPNTGNNTAPSVVVYPSFPSSTYYVTVTNTNGCTAVAEATISVNEKPATSFAGDSIVCIGQVIQVLPNSGGSWTSSNPNIAVVNEQGEVLGVGPGTTTVRYTDNVSGCKGDIMQVDVNVNPTLTASNDQVACAGEEVTITAVGSGYNPLVYNWDQGLGEGQSKTFTATTIDNERTLKDYNVTVTDGNGCIATQDVELTVYPLPLPTYSVSNNICEEDNGSILFSFKNYIHRNTIQLSIDNGASWVEVADHLGTYLFDNLSAGDYTLLTQWSDGDCPHELATVTIEPDFNPTATITFDHGACGSNNEGSITFSITDEPTKTSLEISIDGGASYPYTTPDNVGDYTIPNLAPGTYQLAARWADDACPKDFGEVVLHPATAPIALISGDETMCEGSTLTLTANGGSTYAWNHGPTDNMTTVSPTENTTYTVTVTTLAGCTDVASIDVTVSPELSATIDYNGTQCLVGGSGTISANHIGGLAPHTYNWEGPSGNIGDGKNINITEFGSYYLTVTDASGCSVNTSGFVYQQYEAFIINLQTDVCEGETVTLTATASGAEGYLWSANAGNSTSSTVDVTPSAPSSTYTVTITNSIGCEAEATATIDVESSPATSVSGSADICIGETTNLSPTTGGIWVSSNQDVAVVSFDGVVTGLSEGSAYMTFIESTNGCESTDPLLIQVTDPPNPVFNGGTVLCIGDNTTLLPNTGGTWTSQNPAIASVTNAGVVTALSNGITKFTFTNTTTGCTAQTSQSLLINSRPTVVVPTDQSLCIGDQVQANPGNGGTWISNNQEVATITSGGLITAVGSGKATFTFTSTSTGCASEVSDSLEILITPIVSISGDSEVCVGETTTLSPSTGGTWQSEDTQIATITNTGVVTAVQPGDVRFIFTNSSTGCTSEYSDIITVHPDPVVSILGAASVCVGNTTQLSPSENGTWTSSDPVVATIDNNGVVTALEIGTVYFTYTHTASGCESTIDNPINVLSPPSIELNGPSEICINTTTTLSPSSGGVWTSSDPSIATVSTTGDVTSVSSGEVTFTYTENSTGCESAQSLTLTVLPAPFAEVTGDNSLCIGETSSLTPLVGGAWTSDNTSVATVTNDGTVTAIGAGIARFTFLSDEGCSSNQTLPLVVFNDPTVVLTGPSTTCIGGTLNLLPSSGGTWTSNNETIATITNTGVVTGVSPGTVTFTFTDSESGCASSPSEVITVEDGPTVNISGDNSICIGKTTTLAPTVDGIWESNNPALASVDNSGMVTALASGEATFTFTLISTGCSSQPTLPVTIEEGPSIAITGSSNICVGSTSQLFSAIEGTWESTNPSVASIDANGLVTGLTQGTARFQFTASSTGCKSDLSAPITIDNPPTVSIVGSDEVCVGGTTSLLPNAGGTWMSSDESLATINDDGTVTGIAPGEVYFTFTDSATGCQSDGLLNLTILEATAVDVSGVAEICIGSSTTLSPSTGGSWTSSNPAIATVTNDGVVTGRAPGVVTFEFTDASSGCNIGNITDPVIVSSCINHDFNVTTTFTEVTSSIATNDNTIAGTTYGSTPTLLSKPSSSIPSLTILADGSYTFASTTPGKYIYTVPVCIPPSELGCAKSMLEITVLDNLFSKNNPVSNMEMAITYTGITEVEDGNTIVVDATANDACVKIAGCTLDGSSYSMYKMPANGTASIAADGKITYTPAAGFIGFDTIEYKICVSGDATSCSVTKQVFTVNDRSSSNDLYAADDFAWTMKDIAVSGNLIENDGDPESDALVLTTVGSASSPVAIDGGSYYIDDFGNYTFIPADGFTGYAEIIYTLCDDNADSKCTDATLHLLVFDDLTVPIKMYLEGALMNNNNDKASDNTPLMRDDLRSNPFDGKNYIPVKDPYTFATGLLDYTSQFSKVGPALLQENQEIMDSAGVFSVTGRDAIVDWVFVELRSKENMYTTIATRSGLLQRDGDVVDLDGTSSLRFKGINADSFYVVVKHKSHLGAMSMLVGSNEVVDFRSPDTEVFNFGTTKNNGVDYTGLSVNEVVKPGYRALWAGDFDGNGLIKFANPNDDQNIIFFEVIINDANPQGMSNFDFGYGYYVSDYNMNGKVKFDNPDDDTNLLFFQMLTYALNPAGSANFGTFIEQVPR